MDRDFKGVWIPKELYLNNELSWAEKILLVEIDSLDKDNQGCFASNEYLSKFLMLSEGSVANMIIKLIDKGYIIRKAFDGRKRYISINHQIINLLNQNSHLYESRVHKNMNPEFTKTLTLDSQKYEHSNIINKTDNNTFKKESKKVSLSQKNEESVFDLKYYSELCEILGLLTELTQAKYNIPKTADKVKKYKPYTLIKELFESGFNRANFVDVINCKYKEWAGSSMAIHLVPETLFRKSNFEKYVTQTQIITNKQTPIKDESGNYSDTKEGREQFVLNIRERALELLRKKRTGETYDTGF